MRALRIPCQRLGRSRSFTPGFQPASRHLSTAITTYSHIAGGKPIPRHHFSPVPSPRPFHRVPIRYSSGLTASSPSNPQAETSNARSDQPAYQLTFTCKPCGARSGHRVSKQGYHKGTVLITCPSCKSRHIVSDHLRIFTDEGGDLEEILKKHGGLIKKGQLGIKPGQMVGNEGEQGIEFWEDGTETKSA